MAGSYPNVPGRRMAWDGDGSVALGFTGALLIADVAAESDGVAIAYPYTEFSAGDRQDLNGEDASVKKTAGGGVSSNAWMILGLIFPELRDIDGYFWNGTANGPDQSWLYTSADTTNGRDGSWSALGSQVLRAATDLEAYRDHITSAAVTGVRSVFSLIREQGTGTTALLRRFHIYGDIAAGETPDRLLWIDEVTGVEFTADKDYGDVPRGGSEDIEVRLKNNSATLTANTLSYTTEDFYLDMATWMTLTLPGGSTFQASQNIASLAAATTTGIITVRRVTPGTDPMSVHASRLIVSTTSWS